MQTEHSADESNQVRQHRKNDAHHSLVGGRMLHDVLLYVDV